MLILTSSGLETLARLRDRWVRCWRLDCDHQSASQQAMAQSGEGAHRVSPVNVGAPFDFIVQARNRVREHRARVYAAYADASDPWLGRDKIEHFAACFSITILVYACLARRRSQATCVPLGLAVCTSALVGVAKECGDAFGLWPWCPPCVASGRDMSANLAGTLAAAASLLVCGLATKLQRARRGYSIAAAGAPGIDVSGSGSGAGTSEDSCGPAITEP